MLLLTIIVLTMVIPLAFIIILSTVPDRLAILRVYKDKDSRYRWWYRKERTGYRVYFRMETEYYTSPTNRLGGMGFLTRKGVEKFIDKVDDFNPPPKPKNSNYSYYVSKWGWEPYPSCDCPLCESAKPATKKKVVSSSDVYDTLNTRFPGVLYQKTLCPVCESDLVNRVKVVGSVLDRQPLRNVIIHLNDHHRWTREQIANWLEESDLDILGERKQDERSTGT